MGLPNIGSECWDCLVKKKYDRKAKDRKYTQSPKGKYSDYKCHATRYTTPFNLTFEQFISFWQNKCYYCNSRIATIGLDRVDNTKGYDLSNIVSCCEFCNRMKNSHTLEDFINQCKKIVQVNKVKGFIERVNNAL